ncbi:hypothetical protein [Mucilaginibacter ginsenosidivorans]|uniref:Lipoprotein n=1 Tax=Mucilaginibacter ginsenosidivorans TaxID=398053 RepID=A0A5B8UT51_9SPHI|nr:hypothetical protein [Mucilaginibacter ginsenosidivorans]QEC61561.1 hypothetical protein FRZ54_02820 [Mucilaginibacter ginsenosidivorans]
MKKIYLPLLLSLFLFASCSPHLVTQGIKDKTSNYIVTNDGKRINTSSVSIRTGSVTADTGGVTLTNISAIKQGQAYYGVKDGNLYDGVYYGKLMLLRRYAGRSYNMQTHASHAVYNYYLQKADQPEIIDLNGRNLIESVRDNPLALRKARASRIYANISIISAATAITGLSCVFLPYSSPIRKTAVTVGLFSMPTFLITLPIASHKRYKTIIVYNR